MIHFLRRKGLGAGSLRGMTAYLENYSTSIGQSVISWRGTNSGIVRNDRLDTFQLQEGDLLVRWGCTSATSGIPLSQQVNKSPAIKQVNDKRGFAHHVHMNHPTLTPDTIVSGTNGYSDWQRPMVLRPAVHAQGRNLFVINSMQELLNVVRQHPRVFSSGWYARELVDKAAEYRVYVVQGRVATVAQKTPDNPDAVAWNVAQGGRFDVVNWGSWNMEVVRVAIESFNLTELDFGGVDVMVDQSGRAYLIEINSAPSLPLLSDGSVSYRQKCMAKTFKWIHEHGFERMEVEGYNGWRDVIHPAIQEYE